MTRPTFIHGFGEGSPSGLITQFASAVVLFRAGVKPRITTVPGQHGYSAFEHFQSKYAGDNVFLVADTMTLMLNAVRRKTVERVMAIEPIIKLTNGISFALASSAASGIKQLEDIAAISQKRILRIAHTGDTSASGVSLGWMRPNLPPVKEMLCTGNDTVLKSLIKGDADLALVITNSLPMALKEERALNVLTTFGAERSPYFESVKTYREVSGDDKKSFTSSFSLFARPDVPGEDIPLLTEAFAQPFPPSILKSLEWLAQSVVVNDERTVHQTVQRDLRVALSVANQLHFPARARL
jgi:tripartite-type tricarboxylate transporter receptor subunit TctC